MDEVGNARITRAELLRELRTVMSGAEARALVNRAARIAGVTHRGSLEPAELLLVLESLAAEGGRVQRIADALSARVHGSSRPRRFVEGFGARSWQDDSVA